MGEREVLAATLVGRCVEDDSVLEERQAVARPTVRAALGQVIGLLNLQPKAGPHGPKRVPREAAPNRDIKRAKGGSHTVIEGLSPVTRLECTNEGLKRLEHLLYLGFVASLDGRQHPAAQHRLRDAR